MAILSKYRKLKGGTLVEVLIAFVLISGSAVSGMAIYQNILKSNNLIQKWEVHTTAENMLRNMIKNNLYVDENIEINGVRYEKKVYQYAANRTLYVVEVIAYNNQNVIIANSKQLIIKNEN